MGILTGPTGGFLLGWAPGAFAEGRLAARFARARCPLAQGAGTVLACTVGGIAVIYAFGIPWLAAVTGMGLGKAAVGSLAFVPGDLLKAVTAGLVARSVRRAYPIAAR